MADILVLYYSASGSVKSLAQAVARGIDSVEGMRARVRTVPKVAPVTEVAAPAVPPEGAPYVERRDLAECAGIALGSPTRFGNMAAPMKHFIDSLGAAESPLALVTGDGVPRVVRRRCDLQEHLRGVAGTGSALFPFGPQPRQG